MSQETTIENQSIVLPTVSAIVVSYNVGYLLERTLDAVCHSQDATVELIVVDNASSDGSVELVASRFPDALLIRNKSNVGFGAASNRGIMQSRGEFVMFLNPDVVVDDRCISELATLLRLHPKVGAAGPRLLRPDGRPDLAARRSFPTPSVALFRVTGLSRRFARSRKLNRYNLGYLSDDEVHEIDAGTAACLMVRRSALEQIGGFDTDFFMYGEDLDLCLRLKKNDWKIFYVPSAIAIHEKGASSRQATSAMLWEFHRAMWIFHRKHYARRLPAPMNWLIFVGIWSRWAALRLRARLVGSRSVSP
jgi:GT2 family glycosyltransferase